MSTPKAAAPPALRPRAALTIAFYTQCRLWHGYLSAFAFLALIFFSATGVLLNHPDWLAQDESDARIATAHLSPGELDAARRSTDTGAALALTLERKMALLGAYASGDVDPRQAILRFEGVKGSSDVTLDMHSGDATARLRQADMLSTLDDLHRGKGAGRVWQAVIDISGAIILALSVIGYLLFFSLRFRLRTGLLLTGLSLAALAAIFVFFIP